jgi:hypothetical protein
MAAVAQVDPIFKSVGQALYVAYLLEDSPVHEKGATQVLIEDLLRQRYGEDPIRKSERTINMGNMTPLELRGQCVLIREDVKNHLAVIERDAILARFGQHATRALGVRGLRDYYAALCNTRNEGAVLALLWSIYAPGARGRAKDWSLRDIEKKYGVPRVNLNRDQVTLRSLCGKLETMAQNRLEAVFFRKRLI